MSWTQPMCDPCWTTQRSDRTPARLTQPEPERCSWCGRLTTSGIYVREAPATVPYPAEDD